MARQLSLIPDNRHDVSKTQFGDQLKSWRKSLELTQDVAAQLIGVDKDTYSRWERGITEPSLRHAKAICSAYGIDGDSFLAALDSEPVTPKEKLVSRLDRTDRAIDELQSRLVEIERKLDT